MCDYGKRGQTFKYSPINEYDSPQSYIVLRKCDFDSDQWMVVGYKMCYQSNNLRIITDYISHTVTIKFQFSSRARVILNWRLICHTISTTPFAVNSFIVHPY